MRYLSWRARKVARVCTVLAALHGTWACGGNKAAKSSATSAQTSTDDCSSDARVTPFTAGMTQKGQAGVLTFQIVNSDPAPPAHGTNTWTVAVLDASGQPQTNYTLTLAPFMPDHNHGTSVVPQISVAQKNYTIADLYLFMPGVWRITLSAAAADGTVVDTAVFFFCVQG